MNPITRLELIEQKRAMLLERAQEMDSSVLTTRPAPDKWSILEIIEHLVVCEHTVFGDLSSLRERNPKPRRMGNRLAYHLVMFILRYNIPVPVPDASMNPSSNRTLSELQSMWEATHSTLRRYIHEQGNACANQAIFAHPVSGPITVAQSLSMVDVHLTRHTRQINKIVQEFKSLRSSMS